MSVYSKVFCIYFLYILRHVDCLQDLTHHKNFALCGNCSTYRNKTVTTFSDEAAVPNFVCTYMYVIILISCLDWSIHFNEGLSKVVSIIASYLCEGQKSW